MIGTFSGGQRTSRAQITLKAWCRELGKTRQSSTVLDCLKERIERALGALSLSERTEGSREQAARVEELVTHLTVEKEKVTLSQTLRKLHSFLSIGKDEHTPGVISVRGQVEELLREGDSRGFEYPFLRPYLAGLSGLTYLLEGYRVANANRALPILKSVTQDLLELPLRYVSTGMRHLKA